MKKDWCRDVAWPSGCREKCMAELLDTRAVSFFYTDYFERDRCVFTAIFHKLDWLDICTQCVYHSTRSRSEKTCRARPLQSKRISRLDAYSLFSKSSSLAEINETDVAWLREVVSLCLCVPTVEASPGSFRTVRVERVRSFWLLSFSLVWLFLKWIYRDRDLWRWPISFIGCY